MSKKLEGYKSPTREKQKETPLTLRNCLSCSKPFYSEGIHNRICSDCKSLDVWRNNGLASHSLGNPRGKGGQS